MNSFKRIATIQNEPIVRLVGGDVTYKSDAMIDNDGSGPSEGDPAHANDTSLHYEGEPLNSRIDKWIVVPPQIIRGVRPIVLGCQAFALNLNNGLWSPCVVGDEGPPDKIGEISEVLADALQVPDSPTKGGVTGHIIWYHLIPGQAALVDGRQYTLQPS